MARRRAWCFSSRYSVVTQDGVLPCQGRNSADRRINITACRGASAQSSCPVLPVLFQCTSATGVNASGTQSRGGLDGMRGKARVELIAHFESKVDALGPEIAALEQRGRLRGAHQFSCAAVPQDRILARVDRVIYLVARPNDVVPVHQLVADEGAATGTERIAQFQFHGGKNRE